MVEPRVVRKLSAIVAADVVGYSRLVGADEEGAVARLKAARRAVVDPKIGEHRGRIVNTAGDGILAEFASVVDALRCAVEIQRGMAEHNIEIPNEMRIEFRIGVNVGDVIIDGDDIYGDGVNVAARLEELAEPGGICVSLGVRDQVRGTLDVTFEDAGDQRLKNITHPVRVFRVRRRGTAASAADLALPDKPSIAVLPFQNMSGDPEQEYFADGMVEEIITALSRVKWFFVIARNSSFTYKGKAVDVKQVARDVGVRYVLEGSVRKGGNRVRITGQLIDATTGSHIWADKFEGALDDVFELQDRVTASVVGAIEPKLWQAEIARAKRKPTDSLDAYDYYLHALAQAGALTAESLADAMRLVRKALELDPDFALAMALGAWVRFLRVAMGWHENREQEGVEGLRLAKAAIAIDREDATVLTYAATTLAYLGQEYEHAAMLVDRALVLDPNLAIGWGLSGWVRVFSSKSEEALHHFETALRLSPLDPLAGTHMGGIAYVHIIAHRYAEAVPWARRATQETPTFVPGHLALTAALALVDCPEEAAAAAREVLSLVPRFRIAAHRAQSRFRDTAPLDPLYRGLRKAGLPEA